LDGHSANQFASSRTPWLSDPKPVALLERIISASSNPGDVVLDPFCGCGTAIDAAQKLGRQWIGIDVTHLAIGLVEKRLREAYGDAAQWETIGVPKDLASAQRLAEEKPHDFQNWICLQLGGWPWMGGKKGGDKGVDGYFYYVGEGGQTETGVISVKAGHNVNPNMVRDLGRVMQRDGHKLGLFVSAALPTKGMEAEANSHEPVETELAASRRCRFSRWPSCSRTGGRSCRRWSVRTGRLRAWKLVRATRRVRRASCYKGAAEESGRLPRRSSGKPPEGGRRRLEPLAVATVAESTAYAR
jgi:hypothetical protein